MMKIFDLVCRVVVSLLPGVLLGSVLTGFLLLDSVEGAVKDFERQFECVKRVN